MLTFWTSLLGYQAVWFAAVIGAAHGHVWPGLSGMALYAAWQLRISTCRRTDMALMVAALVAGLLLDGSLIHFGLARYATSWPLPTMPPAWILALWITFALTFTQSLRYLQTRLWLAALLGLVGGPLAYLGAARGWHVLAFASPAWVPLLVLALGWGLATPLLAWLAARGASGAAVEPVNVGEAR